MKRREELKEDICEVGRRLYQHGYIAAMEGNVSIRLSEEEVLSMPAGVCKGYLTPDMIVSCDFAGKRIDGTLRVSTEIEMHLTVYRARPDVRAVVHAHPPKATAFAVAGVPLDRAVLAEVVVTLGCIPLAEYGTPSTKELADSVDRLIRTSDGLLLSNHGVLTVGKEVLEAYYKLEVVEHFAEIIDSDNGEPAGRTLDFLGQEMLREANTIAAKCLDAQISRYIVEVKGVIDRIKEQVQNVE